MIIAIEGNIGCGKTTQLSILEKQGYSIYKEPIDKWPLDEFYQDPSRWGFLLQVVVLRTFIKGTEPISIHERSPMSSKYVFWNNLVESGIVTSLEDPVFAFIALFCEPSELITADTLELRQVFKTVAW